MRANECSAPEILLWAEPALGRDRRLAAVKVARRGMTTNRALTSRVRAVCRRSQGRRRSGGGVHRRREQLVSLLGRARVQIRAAPRQTRSCTSGTKLDGDDPMSASRSSDFGATRSARWLAPPGKRRTILGRDGIAGTPGALFPRPEASTWVSGSPRPEETLPGGSCGEQRSDRPRAGRGRGGIPPSRRRSSAGTPRAQIRAPEAENPKVSALSLPQVHDRDESRV